MVKKLSNEDVEKRLLEKQVERKMLERAGLIDKEKEEKARNVLSPIICWRCKEKNGCTAWFCGRCGADLDEEKIRREMIMLVKEATGREIVKPKEMISLGKKLLEVGKLLEKEREREDG